MTNTRPFQPQDAHTEIKRLEARIRKLEASQRVGVGTYDLDGLDTPIFEILADVGFSLPAIPIPMVPVLPGAGVVHQPGYAQVSGASMLQVSVGQAFQALSDSIQIVIPWGTDATTTGELQVVNGVLGGNSTSTVTLPAGSGGFQTFNWLHGEEISFGPLIPQVFARRTSGAGNVKIFAPTVCIQIGSTHSGATATGV